LVHTGPSTHTNTHTHTHTHARTHAHTHQYRQVIFKSGADRVTRVAWSTCSYFNSTLSSLVWLWSD
jgi:hypothetical protein